MDVAGEVAQGGLSAADGLELDVPLGFRTEGAALVGGEFGEEVGVIVFKGGEEEASKSGGEGAVVDEEIFGLFRAMEGSILRVEGDGRDDAVDVGMVLDLSAPGVEDGGEVELKMAVFKFGAGDIGEGLSTVFEEKVVECFGLMEAQGAELFWYCEGDHEVRDS